MNPRLLLIIPGLMLVFGSCAGRNGSGSTRHGEFETGTVIPKVKCAADTSLSYALYLPSGYADGALLPVYLAFDPQGRGSFPVTIYQELAEKYQFILVGSNDSKNGVSMPELTRIANALVNDAGSRFHADSTRLFLTGFSGGARVACIVGMFMHQVAGVIGCGAGFSETKQQEVRTFNYFVISGETDPNLSEMILQDEALTQARWKHRLLVIQGGHRWPPVTEMDKAVRWMRGELSPMPEPGIPLAEYYGIAREGDLQLDIMKHFVLGDTLWMKKEIRRLRSQSEQTGKQTDSLMAKRLIAFLGLVSWSKSTSQLNQGLLDQAYRSLSIYKMVEPENPAIDSLFRIYYQKRRP